VVLSANAVQAQRVAAPVDVANAATILRTECSSSVGCAEAFDTGDENIFLAQVAAARWMRVFAALCGGGGRPDRTDKGAAATCSQLGLQLLLADAGARRVPACADGRVWVEGEGGYAGRCVCPVGGACCSKGSTRDAVYAAALVLAATATMQAVMRHIERTDKKGA